VRRELSFAERCGLVERIDPAGGRGRGMRLRLYSLIARFTSAMRVLALLGARFDVTPAALHCAYTFGSSISENLHANALTTRYYSVILDNMRQSKKSTVVFKVDSGLKSKAERIAEDFDETLSQVLRRALDDYVEGNSALKESMDEIGAFDAKVAFGKRAEEHRRWALSEQRRKHQFSVTKHVHGYHYVWQCAACGHIEAGDESGHRVALDKGYKPVPPNGNGKRLLAICPAAEAEVEST
jgi:rubrerythrin